MIVVVGSINLDMVASVPHHLAPGETVLADGYAQYHGGKGGNQAVAAARSGAEVHMIGAVGSDPAGNQLTQELRGEGIDITAVHHVDDSSGLAMINIDRGGENCIVVVPGANASLLPETLEPVHFTGASVVLLQLEIPLPTVRSAARIARRAGAIVVLNAAPATRLEASDLADVDWLLVNAGEGAELLNDTRARDFEDAQSQTRKLHESGPSVLMTLGSAGVVWCTEGETGSIPALSVPVVDTTAAGDAFAGVFAQSLDAGLNLTDCIKRANKAGALAVGRAGARDSLPNADVLQFEPLHG